MEDVRRLATAVVASVAVLAAACGSASAPARTDASGVRTIATGLHVPWGIAFLPGGDALVAERTTGNIVRIRKHGGKKVAMHLRDVDTTGGQPLGGYEGGLLGLAVSPHYKRDHWVYAYYSSKRGDNRIVRFHLGGRLHPILTGLGKASIHNGGRIAFGPDGKLYATVGENGERTPAQSLKSRNGKILRINPNGSIPKGNPFKHSPIWSYGHRNPQGLAWDRKGRLWSSELGQDRFDEVNLIRKGRNYGWPVVEGFGSTHGGRYVNPKITFTTGQCSPSGDAILRGTLYVACLGGAKLYRIPMHGTRLGKKTALFSGTWLRLRTVVVAPGGRLWISTSNRDGRTSPRPGDDRIVSIPG
jgi:glucose/arabinose dehydrogenase